MIDITTIFVMLTIGMVGGFISGLVGIGGAIIIYPAILLLPSLFSTHEYTPYLASGLTSSQVFFSTMSGSLKAYKKDGFSKKLVLNMGSGMIFGSILGAILANFFNSAFINFVYIFIALLSLVFMSINIKPTSEHDKFNSTLIVIVGIVIGILSGIVGAGGAFIIIPVLLVLFKLPMNTVVVNSIVIAFMSSIGTFTIKLFQGYIPIESAIFLIISSAIFAPLGLKVGNKIPDVIQKWIVSTLIILAIIQLLF